MVADEKVDFLEEGYLQTYPHTGLQIWKIKKRGGIKDRDTCGCPYYLTQMKFQDHQTFEKPQQFLQNRYGTCFVNGSTGT